MAKQKFLVEVACRLPHDSGRGGHHQRLKDGKKIFPAGAHVMLEPSETVDRLVGKGTLSPVTTKKGGAR